MSFLKTFFAKRVAWSPPTPEQKNIIHQLYDLHSEGSAGIGAVEEDTKNSKAFATFTEHEENVDRGSSPPATSGDIEKQDITAENKSDRSLSTNGDNKYGDKIVMMGDVAVHYISFQENDPENPYNWSRGHKAFCVFIMMFLTFIGGIAGASLSSGVASIVEITECSKEVATLGYSIFIAGFAFGGMVFSPISEDYGRWPCYFVGILGITVFSIPPAVTNHISIIVIFRFIGGLIGSVASSMISGTVADIYVPNERGYPMLWHTVINFAGNVCAPISFGYIGWLKSFRWILYILIIISGFTMIVLFFFMEETRGQVILQRRASGLQRKYGGPNKVFLVAGKMYIPLRTMVVRSVYRPFWFLISEPVVTWFSLWMGFTWGTIYICFGAVPSVMEQQYGFNPGQASIVFVGEAVGVVIGGFLDIAQQYWYQAEKAKRGPEARLYMSCLGGIMCFAGILIFGLCQGRTHWMGPPCGLAILLVGVVTIFQAISLYFADCYGPYASSALAAQSLLRNVFGFVFPLFTSQMFDGMGFTWASVLAALVCAALAIVPFWLLFFGKKLRLRSKYIVNDEDLL